MIKLRLARVGGRNAPFYRIVAAKSHYKRDGKHIEKLGTYDPIPNEVKCVNLKVERIQYWIGRGAVPTATVGRLLGWAGLLPEYPVMRPRTKDEIAAHKDKIEKNRALYKRLFNKP